MRIISYYLPTAILSYIYMLQTVEYNGGKFLRWIMKLPDLRRVQRRGQLVKTHKAKALSVLASVLYAAVDILAGSLLLLDRVWLGLLMFVLAPFITAVWLALVVWLSSKLLNIYRRPLLGQAERLLAEHQATKVAVLGSYGKTTMKELLTTVLGQARTVQATPGNMNVPISHARWVTSRVEPDSEILIFEYGEGEPGDIARFARLTHPDYAVVTGMAPNHLDKYASFEALADDLASIKKFVDKRKLYVHRDGSGLSDRLAQARIYDGDKVADWQVSDIQVGYQGTSFTMKRDNNTLQLHSPLLGRHQVGPLAAVAAMALEMGLTPQQVEQGIAKTTAYEHRMQPRSMHGAWLIDDTYNGNLEGIRAGLQLLQDLPAKRKIYVTPGLVDQGKETQRVHTEIGQLIAEAKPDKVVLMENSVRPIIQQALEAQGYDGELLIETNPLEFYSNIEHTIASADLVVMQNDWTDNYI